MQLGIEDSHDTWGSISYTSVVKYITTTQMKRVSWLQLDGTSKSQQQAIRFKSTMIGRKYNQRNPWETSPEVRNRVSVDPKWTCVHQIFFLKKGTKPTQNESENLIGTYCSDISMDVPDKRTMGSRQYPSTLTTQLDETPVMLIRLSSEYIARQPTTPMP